MQIEELHWALENEWNKLSNNHRKYLTDLEKDRVLNISIFDYVEMFFHGENRKGFNLGFEVNRQRLDMLDTLVFSYPEQPELNVTQASSGIYYFDLTKTIKPFKSYITGRVKVQDCDHYLNVTTEQHGDMGKILSGFHRKTSKIWQHVAANLRNDRLYIETTEVVPLKLRLTYLKKPNEVSLGTYTEVPTLEDPNPAIKAKVQCDLPADYHDILITIAVQNLHRIYGDPGNKDLQTDKLYTIT